MKILSKYFLSRKMKKLRKKREDLSIEKMMIIQDFLDAVNTPAYFGREVDNYDEILSDHNDLLHKNSLKITEIDEKAAMVKKELEDVND